MIIETERLLLREMMEEDLPSLYKVLADPDIMKHYPYVFDESMVNGEVSDIDSLIKGLENGDISCLDNNMKNALYSPAITLNEEVLKNTNALKDLAPKWQSMSGSGATVFAVYENFEMASWAVDKLKKQGYSAELLETYDYKKAKFVDLLLDKLVYED